MLPPARRYTHIIINVFLAENTKESKYLSPRDKTLHPKTRVAPLMNIFVHPAIGALNLPSYVHLSCADIWNVIDAGVSHWTVGERAYLACNFN